MAGYFKFLALTGIIALQSIIVTGQIVPAQTLSADAQEETAKYERYYEIILDNALSDYYREGTFIVDVKATLERILIPKGYEVIQPQQDIKIENLPGLPFIPPNIQKNRSSSQDSLKASGFDARFQLTRLNIKVPTAPNPAALLDRNNEISDIEEEQEEDNEREEVIENSMFPLSPDTIIQTVVAEREKKMFLGIDWNNPEQLIFIIIALGILFLLALFMAISRKTKAKDEEQIMQDMGQTTPVLQNPQIINTEVKTPEPQKGPTVREMAKFEGDKTFIANMCISKPKIVADIISEWIENDEEQGVSKAVKSLISVDDKLLTILKPHISSNTFEMINFGINNFDALTLEERISETENFRSSITTYKASTDAEGSQNSLFDFVDQLTDDDKRISVLLKMGKINNIPISVYKKVASHFSNKALEISDMKYVAADGVETILNTIETMPLSEQDAYVASIAEQDLELAKKIKKFFIGFDDLPKVKIELIKSALDEIPSETLILALRTAPAAVREKVLKSRTKRDQQLILSEIEMPSEATNSEVEDAQKTILYAVRRKMKTEA